MSISSTTVPSSDPRLHAARGLLALLLALTALFFVAPARAQDEQLVEARIGPFHATGEWTLEETSVSGRGAIEAPWGGEIQLEATYDVERKRGKWQGEFSHPVLGKISVASGEVSDKALTFKQKIVLGVGTVTFDMVLTPESLTGEGKGTLRAGKVSFGSVGLKFGNGTITAAAEAQARLPGLSTPVALTLVFEGTRFAAATGTAKVNLGPYTFAAETTVGPRGDVMLSASESQALPGIGQTQLALVYADGRVSATGTRTVSLGSIAFENTTITLDKSGKISLENTSSVSLPGIGSTELTLAYANGKLSASGKRQVKLGTYAFDNTAITVGATGIVTLSKQAALNLPVIGSTQMTLAYADGVLSASGSRTVVLGSFSFSSTAISLDSSGNVGIAKTQSVSIPGLGSTQMTLAFANGVLSATGSRSVTLGSYGFSDVAISIDSNGAVSLNKRQSLNLPVIGSTEMTLSYANGVLSATGTRTVSLGRYGFDNTAIVLDSSGVLAAQKQQSLDIPGIGSTQMTLTFVNGAFSALGSRSVSLGRYGFDNTAIAIDSSGNVSASKTASLNLPVIGSTQMHLGYANGVLSATGTRSVNLGNYAFSDAAISIDSSGALGISKTQSVNVLGVGVADLTLSYADGVLSASGMRGVNMGNYAFSNAAISISSTGTVSVSKREFIDIPGLGRTEMDLSYANGVASASGSRNVSLGSYGFSDVAIAIDSSGNVTVDKQQSLSIPGIGSVALTLGYANREVTANGTASISVSVLGRSVSFGSAAVHISSSGQVSVSASQGLNIGPVHYNISITYENGSIKVHY